MEYSISHLAKLADVTPRTIRYYVEIGLLAPPEGAGKTATYGGEHLERLAEIKELQARRFKLEEIRDLLSAGTHGQANLDLIETASQAVRQSDEYAVLREPQAWNEPPDGARAYLERLRSELREPPPRRAGRLSSKPRDYGAQRWLRIELAPDVELHVRRRGGGMDRRISALIKQARKLFEEGES